MPTIEIQTLDAMRLAYIAQKGPYSELKPVFEKVLHVATAQELFGSSSFMLGLYYDDPSKIAPDQLRACAAVNVPVGVKIAIPLHEMSIPQREYAICRHIGPYEKLPETYAWLFEKGLAQIERQDSGKATLEIYRNNPANTAANDLLTDICVALVPQA